MDWGGRRHLYEYLCAYPQLFPMFASLVYKLTGTAGTVLPASTFALHAINPFLALFGLTAVVLVARRMEAPSWPLVLGLLGMKTWREQLMTGTADIMVTTFVMVAVAIGLGLARTDESVEPGRWALLGILLFGALAVKTTGFLATVVVAGWLLGAARTHSTPGSRKAFIRQGLVVLVVPAFLNLPFYGEQFYTERTLMVQQQDLHELNMPFANISSTWKGARDAVTGPTFTLRRAVDRVLDDYTIPGWLHLPLIVLGALLLLVGLLDPWVWPVGLATSLYVPVWMRFFSYDLRNLLPAIPLLILWLTSGGVRLWALGARWPRLRSGLSIILAGTALVWPIWGGCVPYLANQWRAFGNGQLVLHRLRAIEDGPVEKIRQFFPDQYPEYLLLKNSGLADAARQVVAGGHLYRFFPNGRYPWSRFWWGNLEPGDVFVGPSSAGRSRPDAWLLIRDAPLQVWVFNPAQRSIPLASLMLTGVHPPALVQAAAESMTVTFSGAMSVVVFNVLKERPEPGSRIIWWVDCKAGEGTAAVTPSHLVYSPSVLDETASTTAIDHSHAGVVRYAGMLTLTRRPLSTDPRDGVLVGLRSDVPGTQCELKEFRVAVSPPSVP